GAKTVLDAAISRTSQELAAKPRDTNLRFIVAKCRLQRALVDANANAPPESWRGPLAEALQALEQLVTEFSRTASFRRNLAEALTAEAEVNLAQGQHDAAVTAADRAVADLERLDADEGS